MIKHVKELARLVEPTELVFRDATSRPTLGLLCNCTWEEEHGVAVKFEDGDVTDVGFQDIVL